MEKEVVKKEPVKERTEVEAANKEDVKGEIAMEELVEQPPTGKGVVGEEGGLFCKLRELKKKILGHLLCMS